MSDHIPHTAKAILFSCIDDRLVEPNFEFISDHGDAFHASLAGGGASFLDPAERTVAVKQVVAAYTINDIKTVYLQSHTDCGAYRLAGMTFDSEQAELNRLYGDLDTAAGYVRDGLRAAGANLDEITVKTYVIDPAGRFQPRP